MLLSPITTPIITTKGGLSTPSPCPSITCVDSSPLHYTTTFTSLTLHLHYPHTTTFTTLTLHLHFPRTTPFTTLTLPPSLPSHYHHTTHTTTFTSLTLPPSLPSHYHLHYPHTITFTYITTVKRWFTCCMAFDPKILVNNQA